MTLRSDLSRKPGGRGEISPMLDRGAIGLVFLFPLLPPPTSLGIERLVVPALLAAAVAYGYAAISLRIRFFDARASRVPTLAVWMAVPLLIYLSRIFLEGSWADLPFFFSRLLLVAVLLVMVRWLEVTDVPAERVMGAFACGFMVLAVMLLVLGSTRWAVLGEIRPSRGWVFSFGKTTGWPRSSGEVGIMLSLGLAYLLAFWRSLRPIARWAGLVLTVCAVLVVQSRNVLMASLAVLAGFAIAVRRFPVLVRALLVVAVFASPLIAEAVAPTLETTALGSEIIGERGLRANIYNRFELLDLAVEFSLDDPLQAVVGSSRAEWNEASTRVLGEETAVHNHFAASALNLGLVGAVITIGILFVQPLWRILRPGGFNDRLQVAVYAASLGTIISLSFYDGFFSPSLMLLWALLSHVAFHPASPALPGAARQQLRW